MGEELQLKRREGVRETWITEFDVPAGTLASVLVSEGEGPEPYLPPS